ncbi:hypothetical protein A0H76_350 [Hepatospora eriocheir]|uniref:Ubiquitin-like domain-containing protein n=1 Tax=Hepatospora eriocheir TaxID=1081669 RepID=A0A1X0Q9Z2_9MICR|nr:hypothetical protein HERIO_1466 [Hepatospora eriocheir]ORE00520.1 hypothetical protein A0H76_350 [Hepatospora eriocheir]
MNSFTNVLLLNFKPLSKRYLKINSNVVWELKKIIHNKLKIGVSKQIISYKNKILSNKENTKKYKFVILKLKK